MVFIIYYIIGYVVTLFLFSRYGKKYLGLDYDGEKTYVNYDDWNSNAEAYAAWSIAWPLVYVALIIIVFYKSMMWLSRYFININKDV